MDDLVRTIVSMDHWLSTHAEDPRYEARWGILCDQIDRISEVDGWPSDTPEDRRRLLTLAELNGYPAIPSLGIAAGADQAWRCFLASACAADDLQKALAAIRRL